MDIRYLSRRSHEYAAQSGSSAQRTQAQEAIQAAQASQATAAAAPQAAAPVASEGTAEQPATLSRFTPAGRLLSMLQSFEQRRPEETKNILSNIADRLRSDAENAGVFSERLDRWADRFDAAAESGDMSKLMPRMPQHFGMRAYQQAQQQPDGDDVVGRVSNAAEAATTREALPQPEIVRDRGEGMRVQPVLVPESGSDMRVQPIYVPDQAKVDGGSDMRVQPIYVPDQAKVDGGSNMRVQPIYVPDQGKFDGGSDMRVQPIYVPDQAKVDTGSNMRVQDGATGSIVTQ
jgi:hypothetical protein